MIDARARIFVRAEKLHKTYQVRRGSRFQSPGVVTAVDQVSFAIAIGTTFGLVGESGSGKSTIAKILLKLERPTSGSLSVDGADVFQQDTEKERAYRRMVQIVLQDPYGALNPRLRARDIIGEPLEAQGFRREDIQERTMQLLDLVGLSRDALHHYPSQFSGGQRQRIAIARALSVDPRLLVLDEPVSALDVSIRAQILLLLRDMQKRLGLTYLFIGHDLAVVRYLSDNVGVMYFGRMVEIGRADRVLHRPLHPYTKRLVAVASMSEPLGHHRLVGELPDPLRPPSGCQYRTRCPFATRECALDAPELRVVDDNHQVACHRFEAIERDNAKSFPSRTI